MMNEALNVKKLVKNDQFVSNFVPLISNPLKYKNNKAQMKVNDLKAQFSIVSYLK